MIDMARKDNKGRNLKTGEYQRPDGRYEYRYKDEITGKRNSVYAADLALSLIHIYLTVFFTFQPLSLPALQSNYLFCASKYL